MLKQFILKLMKKLGWVPANELLKCELELTAIRHAHEETLFWFRQPLMYIAKHGKIMRVAQMTPIEDRMPVEYIKRNLASKVTETLLAENLITFDVVDDTKGDYYASTKLLIGTFEVVIPVSYMPKER